MNNQTPNALSYSFLNHALRWPLLACENKPGQTLWRRQMGTRSASPKSCIFPSFGNADTAPVDYFSKSK